MDTRFFYWIVCLAALSAVSMWLYSPALEHGFQHLWDDDCYVFENEYSQQSDGVRWHRLLSSFQCGNWHPLTTLSHALDYRVFGDDPWGHHLGNLILHTLNTLLVFLLGLMLFRLHRAPRPGSTDSLVEPGPLWLAAGASALLFAVHPQHVESVAWIAERKEVLCMFFMLSAFIAYLMAARSAKYCHQWYGLAFLCHLLALTAKPMAVSLPFLLMILDAYPLRRADQKNKKPWLTILADKWPFIAASLVSVVLTLLAQKNSGFVASLQLVELDVRLLNAANSLYLYLVKWLFPFYLNPFYELPLQLYHNLYQLEIWIPVAVVLLITGLVILIYRHQPWWLAAWTFYCVALLPVLGIVHVGSQAMADRYAYLPTLPAYYLAGAGFLWGYRSLPVLAKPILLLMILALTLFWGLLTRQQLSVWRNEFSLWTYVVSANPDSGLGHLKLATLYRQQRQYKKSAAHYYFASRLLGPDNNVRYHLAYVHEHLNNEQQAIDLYKNALDEGAGNLKDQCVAWHRLARLYALKGDEPAAKQAREQSLRCRSPAL